MAFLTPGNASRLRENFHLPLHAKGDYCERDDEGKGWDERLGKRNDGTRDGEKSGGDEEGKGWGERLRKR